MAARACVKTLPGLAHILFGPAFARRSFELHESRREGFAQAENR